MSVAFIVFGWEGEGIIHKVWLIFGGLCFGHILTKALNYVENYVERGGEE
jgi:hypothetical protein